MIRVLLLLAAIAALALPARAQDRATLLADQLSILDGNRLVATGNVEIFYQGQILTAQSLIYDATLDRLIISGPIRVQDANGNVLFADQAELSGDLGQGILTSARLVLANRLQLAAAEISRSESGQFHGLVRVAASSCNICAGQAPLWEIRARSVLHDTAEQQLYFSGAQLRFAGVPVFYLPRLRLPDPSVERASGFLTPKLSYSSNRGSGIRFPYFLALGQSRDLTVTPLLTTKSGRTVELRYREALRRGDYMITGALTQDDLTDAVFRGYLEGEGTLSLPLGFTATGTGILVSDGTYLSDYGISDADRLDSRANIVRTRRNEHFEGQIIGYQSLREGEGDGTLPVAITDLMFHRRFSGGPLGGQSSLLIEGHSHYRPSDESGDLDGDGIADGRDLARLSFAGDWRRNWIIPNGMILATMAEVHADYYAISQDNEFGGRRWRTHGVWASELRWPLAKASTDGSSQLLEPIVQVVMATGPNDQIPNEDSALVEFDEGNLFDLNRFPGSDGKESGVHLNFGGTYLYQSADNMTLGLTMGRVLRLEDFGQFSDASGLSGTRSDWLLSGSVTSPNGLTLNGRALLDDDLSPTKTEVRLDMSREDFDISLGLTDLSADPAESRTIDTQEVVLSTAYDVSDFWTVSGNTRYDLVTDSTVSSGAGLSFMNECLKVDLSVSRRFGSSTSVRPATDFGLTVELLGFGGGEVGPTRQCRN